MSDVIYKLVFAPQHAALYVAAILSMLLLGKVLLNLRGRAFTPMLSRLRARFIKSRDYTDEGFLSADGAPKHCESMTVAWLARDLA